MRPRTLFVALLAVTLALGSAIPAGGVATATTCTSSGSPTVVTDKSDYFRGQVVQIKATGLTCGATYTITVRRPDTTTQVSSAVASDEGAAAGSYLFGNESGDFEVGVADATGAVVATTHFHGSHFRYGHLTWRPVGTRTAEFTLTNAFRRGYPGSGPDGRAVTGDQFTETIGGTSLCFGDGVCTGTLRYEVLSYDIAQDWVIGRAIQPGGGIQAAPGTGVTVNETEPNDSIATANTMGFGDDFAGTTIGCGPTDYVRFTVPSAQTVSLTIVQGTLSDSFLWLFDGAGTQIAFNDDFFGLASHIQMSLAAGTYYAGVGGFSCSSGTYTLQVRGTTTVAPGAITHTYLSDGPFTAQISSCCRIFSLQNGSSGSYIVSSRVRFDVVDSSPVSALPPIVNAPTGNPAFTFLVPGADANGDSLSFRVANSGESGVTGIPGLTVDPSTGLVTWSTVGLGIGQLWTTQIIIEERRGGSTIGQVGVDFIIRIVSQVGNPPSCAFTPAQTTYNVAAGSPVSFTVSGTDPDVGDTVQLNTAGLPPGATMTPALPRSSTSPVTSVFNWTPPANQNNATFVVAFTVTDQNGLAAQCSVTINVTAQPTNRPPTANAGGTYTVGEGASVTLNGSGTDPDGNPLTYAWDLNNDGTFETPGQSVTFSAAGLDGPSSSTVALRVCDNGTPSLCATSTAVVNVLNVAPTASAANNGPIAEGSPAIITVTASDPAGALDPLMYSFDCDNNGTYEVGPQASNTAACSFDDNGTFTVGVSVSDGDGGVTTASTTVTVNNVPPTLTAVPNETTYWGLPLTFSAVTITDPSGADTAAGFQVGWLFGDPAHASPPYDQSGLNLLQGVHTYALPGVYNAKVEATDKDGGRDARSAAGITVTINKRPSALACTNASGLFGFGTTLSATLSDPINPATAILGGNTVTFAAGGATVSGTTDAAGLATSASPLLMPGTYTVNASFAGNGLYGPSTATCSLTISGTPGKVTGGSMRAANNGRGGFNVRSDGTTVSGELQFQNDAINVHAHTLTALAVSLDGTKAWFAGVGTAGETVLVYVEDNGEPGKADIFRIWVNGTSQNGTGAITGGNIQIHK